MYYIWPRSELRDVKRLAKYPSYFLFARVYRGFFFPHSTNTFSDRFDEVRPLSKRFKHVQKLKRGTTCVFMHFVWIGLLSLISFDIRADIRWYLLISALKSIVIRVDLYALFLRHIVGPLAGVKRINRAYPIWTTFRIQFLVWCAFV